MLGLLMEVALKGFDSDGRQDNHLFLTDPLLLEELLEEKKPHLKPVTPKPSHSNETALVILPVQQCLKEW